MKLRYDPEADAAYLYLVDHIAPGAAVRTVVAAVEMHMASVNIDFDEDGRILGIEVLGASRVLAPETLAASR